MGKIIYSLLTIATLLISNYLISDQEYTAVSYIYEPQSFLLVGVAILILILAIGFLFKLHYKLTLQLLALIFIVNVIVALFVPISYFNLLSNTIIVTMLFRYLNLNSKVVKDSKLLDFWAYFSFSIIAVVGLLQLIDPLLATGYAYIMGNVIIWQERKQRKYAIQVDSFTFIVSYNIFLMIQIFILGGK